VVAKAVDEAASAVVVVPHWPTQPWWPLLAEAASDQICLVAQLLDRAVRSRDIMIAVLKAIEWLRQHLANVRMWQRLPSWLRKTKRSLSSRPARAASVASLTHMHDAFTKPQ